MRFPRPVGITPRFYPLPHERQRQVELERTPGLEAAPPRFLEGPSARLLCAPQALRRHRARGPSDPLSPKQNATKHAAPPQRRAPQGFPETPRLWVSLGRGAFSRAPSTVLTHPASVRSSSPPAASQRSFSSCAVAPSSRQKPLQPGAPPG